MKMIIFAFLFLSTVQAQQDQPGTPFSGDSALAYLRVISVGIGPRPMGSPAEQRAMEFAVAKFREFGLDEAYIMPMTQTVSTEIGGGVNTNSGIAVGVLRGRSDRIILLGGHIDSASPEIPGTNDDGSGTAVVIELARALSQKDHSSTIVFALFGGEEQGLRGSYYFVKNFRDIDKVALMIQIDMANGAEWLAPLVDVDKFSSPPWLVEASYEELEKLGHTGLYFPVHFYTFLTALPGGGIGSDHQPFLERGIPAIDFTSDVNDPIHTHQDNFENFKPAGLQRSGDLVYRLVERFDPGVPEPRHDSYFVVQFRSSLFFFPLWSLVVFIVLSLVVTAYALLIVRKNREPESLRRTIPALKLFLLMLIVQTFVWLSENVVGLLKGSRIPWFAEPTGYFVLGFLAGVLGIWISLQVAPFLSLSRQAYRYYLRAIIALIVFLGLAALASVKLALYPAIALFLLAVAVLVRNVYLKLLFWFLSPHVMYHLMFNEGFGLMARSFASLPGESAPSGVMLHLFYILFFSLWSFPFLLGFAAIRFQSGRDLLWLSRFGKPAGGIITALSFIGLVFYLSTRPSFSTLWQQTIHVNQRLDFDEESGSVELSSNDYLSGTRVRIDGRDTSLSDRSQQVRLASLQAPREPWISVRRTVDIKKDSVTTYNLRVAVHSKYRPYSMTLSYSVGKEPIENVSTPFSWSPGFRSVRLRWFSFPDTSLLIPLTFTTNGSDSLKEVLEATFVEPVLPVEVHKENASVIYRTTMRVTSYVRPEPSGLR